MPRKWKNGEPMKELHDKLMLGKGSSFVKSHLSRLPRRLSPKQPVDFADRDSFATSAALAWGPELD
jgi:hypothetical protein